MGRHSIPGPDDFADEPFDDVPHPDDGGGHHRSRDPGPSWQDTAAGHLDDEYEDEYPDEGYPDDEYADDEYADDGYADEGYPDGGHADDEFADHEFADHGYLDEGYSDDEFAEDEYADDSGDAEPSLTGRRDSGEERGGGQQWRISRRSREQWRGGHRSEGGRRGVSFGVVAALVAVIVLVGAVILWRFFGTSLSHRSDVAAGRCIDGKLVVAVVADPSIADHLQDFADRFNKSAKPVGDRCVAVQVKPADSDAVVSGFIGDWPAQLGERPALWVPGSSVSAARLQAAAGQQIVSDSRSLVTSPVLLAVRPELKSALQKQNWATLPGLQTNPDALTGLNLPGWGSLRLALPVGGNGDAAFLAAEAVAAASAPPGAPASAGTAALRTLIAGQPKLADNSLAEAMNVLLQPGNAAAAPVHAVITTEQQLFTRGQSLSDANGTLGSWLPPGPVPVADYPAVLLAGSWLSKEQVSAASEFARFTHKADQLAELAKAGFRVQDIAAPSSEVTDFAPLPATFSVGDDAQRVMLADTMAAPASGAVVTIMLDTSMSTDDGDNTRLANVVAALKHRIQELPPDSTAGLWTFDNAEGRSVVSTGPLDAQVGGQPRTAALTSDLANLSSTSGGAVSFTTLRMVYNDALANYQAGHNNSVLVITTGPHTDRTLDGQGLQDFIRKATDPQRPVAVNVIDFGGNADRATWQAIAQLSGGSYQSLATSNSPELAAALGTLLN